MIAMRTVHEQSNPERNQNLSSRGLLFGIDLEDLVEPGDPENLQQVGMDAAKLELAFDRGDFLLEVDELAERGAGEICTLPKFNKTFL